MFAESSTRWEPMHYYISVVIVYFFYFPQKTYKNSLSLPVELQVDSVKNNQQLINSLA